jgi:putative ABC transport system permease protein
MSVSVMDSAFNVFSLALAFALIGFNVYVTTSIMKITDLTCDGSVTIGGCTYGALVCLGANPVIALVFAVCIGVLAGFITSALTNHINIEPALASIITLTAIQTLNVKLASVGKVIPVSRTILRALSMGETVVVALAMVMIISFVFYRIMNSEYGLAMRVFGDGKIISESLGINTNRMLFMGLGLANGLSAAGGALITQITGNFSVTMGSGSLVFGIAAVIIGEKLISPSNAKRAILGCVLGSIIYKTLIELFTFTSTEALGTEYKSIVTAIVLIFLMASISDRQKSKRLENV